MDRIIILVIAYFCIFLLDLACAYVMLIGLCLIFGFSEPAPPVTLALATFLFFISGIALGLKTKN